MLHHVTCHVAAMSHASSSSKKKKEKKIWKKKNIKSRKIDKRKRKRLVSKAFYNIRDRDWNPKYPFYSIHSDLFLDIADTFDLLFSYSTNFISTRYSDNNNDSNSVINLIFFRSNSLELNNYLILPDLWYSLDHTTLVVNIHISEEFIQDNR